MIRYNGYFFSTFAFARFTESFAPRSLILF